LTRKVAALLFLALSFAHAAAMDIRVAGNQLIMSGPLAGNEVAQLRDVLPANPQIDTIILRDSPGGFVATAMRVGELFRERGFRTATSGYCMSACVLMFIGGRERSFADGKPGGLTFIALHTPVYSTAGGQTWPLPGTTFAAAQGEMRYWIDRHLGERADRVLIGRAIENNHPQGFMYFYDHVRLKRADGVSVFQCKGPEKKKIADCETIPGTDALRAGLTTSDATVAVNP